MQEQTPVALKVAIILLGIVAVGMVVLMVAKMQGSREGAPEVSTEAPATGDTVQTETPEADLTVIPPAEVEDAVAEATISQDIQSKINAITAQVDRGELTLEEAQEQVNKLLGI